MTLILTGKLAETVEQSEIDALYSRLTAIQEMNLNPMGVEIRRFGNATAFSVKNIPGPSFNTVKGIKNGDEKYLGEILKFYNQREIPIRFELTPAHASLDLLTYLHKEGFYQSDFHTTLYTSLSQGVATIDEKVSIRRLKRNEFDTFAKIYAAGFQMPPFLESKIAQNNEILYDNEHWTFYLASVDDQPAGIGVLFVKDGVASLAAATTVPSERNKGVHTALVKKRLAQAKSLNCNLVVSQARFASTSQNNMERAGMQIAYTQAIWVKG